MDKQLSLLYHWRLQNVRQAKHLCSTTFVGTNSHCDVINALCTKPVITWTYFLVFWQWDQYHYPFQIQSDLFKSFQMLCSSPFFNRVARWNAYIFQFYLFADIVRSPSPVVPWARNLALGSWANAATARGGPKIATAPCASTCSITLLYCVRMPSFHCASSAVIMRRDCARPSAINKACKLGGKPP